MKLPVKDGKISALTVMGKRLERFGEVRIVDETKSINIIANWEVKWLLIILYLLNTNDSLQKQ